MKVLIVEDELITLKFLANALLDDDIELIVAKSADDALALAISSNPDLVITDINMPDKSGLELSAEIKSNPLVSHIPILAVSSDENAKTVKGAFHVLMVDYIQKPVDPQYLRRLVKIHSGLHNIHAASRKFQAAVAHVRQQMPPLNIRTRQAVH